MEFFNSAVNTLQTIVIGLGGGLCVWGGVNLLEGYGQDNPGANAFQSTRPVWGATGCLAALCKVCFNFNPRAPCGARPLPTRLGFR